MRLEVNMCISIELSFPEVKLKRVNILSNIVQLPVTYVLFNKMFKFDADGLHSQYSYPNDDYSYTFLKSSIGYTAIVDLHKQDVDIDMITCRNSETYSNILHVDHRIELGYHCLHYHPENICVSNKVSKEIVIPVLSKAMWIQLIGNDNSVVVMQFIIPEPTHLWGVMDGKIIDKYTAWYKKFDKYMTKSKKV